MWTDMVLWTMGAVPGDATPRPKPTSSAAASVNKPANSRALVLAELGDQHRPFVDAARLWLSQFAAEHHFDLDYMENAKTLNATSLPKYQAVIQLNYPPYGWPPEATNAFREYIEKGQGGWVGLHHATLLGEFDGYAMWPWFSDFMGGIRFKNYIASFVSGNVQVEDRAHPVMRGLPESFRIAREEFYTYDRSPRPRVRVLASVDEQSYEPDSALKMGDHPVVWTNDRMAARNIYIFMGHGPDLFANKNYTALLRNSILWAAGKEVP
jgi:type 1 glutamine amidotransferase